jgi:hypothetical protein
MSIGLAIFLASVLLILVMLYGITKDRWRWRRIAKLCALILITPVALTGAVIGGLYVWRQLPATIYPQTEYAGLRLGISPDEVIYIKGYPLNVYGPPEKEGEWAGFQRMFKAEELEKGEHVKNYQGWLYEDGFKRIDIKFNTEKSAVVEIECMSRDRESQRRCPPIFGVTDGDSEREVIRKLGPPGTFQIEVARSTPKVRALGGTKFMSYPNVGMHLRLRERAGLYAWN